MRQDHQLITHVKTLLSKGSASATSRRAMLNSQMDQALEKGFNCQSCWGKCCTYHANSMHVTPIEALDVFMYLYEQKLWNPYLEKKLKQTISDYRLDYELNLPGKKLFRRSYTCPFYSKGTKGCGLSREDKPYGCLAFNPRQQNITDGQDCHSDQDLLQDHDSVVQKVHRELEGILFKNSLLREHLKWSKKDLPTALMDLSKVFPFDISS